MQFVAFTKIVNCGKIPSGVVCGKIVVLLTYGSK